jgi:hypothetical protein
MTPPILANWLLKRLVSSSDADAVAGDLHEQLANGRSRLWYWRQVVTAVVVHSTHDVGHSKLMAERRSRRLCGRSFPPPLLNGAAARRVHVVVDARMVWIGDCRYHRRPDPTTGGSRDRYRRAVRPDAVGDAPRRRQRGSTSAGIMRRPR